MTIIHHVHLARIGQPTALSFNQDFFAFTGAPNCMPRDLEILLQNASPTKREDSLFGRNQRIYSSGIKVFQYIVFLTIE